MEFDFRFGVDFGSEGRVVLIRNHYRAQLWDPAAGRPLSPALQIESSIRSAALSPDGRTIMTGDGDGNVRLWDAATGRAIGRPMKHEFEVNVVRFSPDGRTALTGSSDRTARLWDVAEWPDEWSKDLTPRIEAMTGSTLNDQGEIRYLDHAEWSERLAYMATNGVRLSYRPGWIRDPILYGTDPTARAKAWIERGRWAAVETAFDEAVVARPEEGRVLFQRGRLFAAHSRPELAAADFARALSLNVLSDLWFEIRKNNPDLSEPEMNAEAAKLRAELSKDVLASRAIGHRVYDLVPRELFDLLDPLTRARYWVDRGRGADARAAYENAYRSARNQHLDTGSILIECGRFLAACGKTDEAFEILLVGIRGKRPGEGVAEEPPRQFGDSGSILRSFGEAGMGA